MSWLAEDGRAHAVTCFDTLSLFCDDLSHVLGSMAHAMYYMMGHTKSQLGSSFEFPQRMDGRLSCRTLPSLPVQVAEPLQHYSTTVLGGEDKNVHKHSARAAKRDLFLLIRSESLRHDALFRYIVQPPQGLKPSSPCVRFFPCPRSVRHPVHSAVTCRPSVLHQFSIWQIAEAITDIPQSADKKKKNTALASRH